MNNDNKPLPTPASPSSNQSANHHSNSQYSGKTSAELWQQCWNDLPSHLQLALDKLHDLMFSPDERTSLAACNAILKASSNVLLALSARQLNQLQEPEPSRLPSLMDDIISAMKNLE